MSQNATPQAKFRADEHSIEFRMVLKAFEVAVYLAHYFELCSSNTLELLLQKATMRVQLGMKMSVREQAVKLDCSERTVNLRRKKLLEPCDKSTFRLMLQLIQSGKHTRESILASCREDFSFDVVEVSLDMLTRQGYIEPMKAEHDAPIVPVQAHPPRHNLSWVERELESRHLAQLLILESLSLSPHTELEVEQVLIRQNVAQQDVKVLLSELEYSGKITRLESPTESPRRWTLSQNGQRMIIDEPNLRWRSGVLDMFTLLKRQLTAVLRAPNDETFAQRNFRFTASPDQLKHFIREHRQYVLTELEKLEKQADPATSRAYGFTWLMAELLADEQLI